MKCYSPKEAADLLGCSDEMVRRWIASGDLLAFNIGKGKKRARWKIPAESLDDFIRAKALQDSPQPVGAVDDPQGSPRGPRTIGSKADYAPNYRR